MKKLIQVIVLAAIQIGFVLGADVAMLLITQKWYAGKNGDSGGMSHSKNPWQFSKDSKFTTLKDGYRGRWTYDDEMLKLKWDGGIGYANFRINWVSKPENKFTFECVDSGWGWMKGWTIISQATLGTVCATEN